MKFLSYLFLMVVGLLHFVALAFSLPRFPSTASQPSILDDLFPRQPITISRMGVNAFVNEPRFGSIRQQFQEVHRTLGIRYVRVLFAWNDQVQPSPGSEPNFSFYDDIARSIPRRMKAVVVLTGIPSWMSNSANWINGSANQTFAQLWAGKVARRYRKNSRLKAFQIWNEPNNPSFSENEVMGFLGDAGQYVDLLERSRAAFDAEAPAKIVVNAATTAINQNFPETLEYNQDLVAAGAANFVDVWAIHYYGTQYENVLLGGIPEFLDGIQKPIWVTESGEQGINQQLEYVERTWPFLRSRIPGIARFYFYQFTEDSPSDVTFGLRNLTQGSEYSDLYHYLKEQKAK